MVIITLKKTRIPSHVQCVDLPKIPFQMLPEQFPDRCLEVVVPMHSSTLPGKSTLGMVDGSVRVPPHF